MDFSVDIVKHRTYCVFQAKPISFENINKNEIPTLVKTSVLVLKH